jgi:ATP-dependent helicase/nuclease subunit B
LGEANLLPVTKQNLEPARKLLDEVIDQVSRQFYADLAPAIDRVWDDGIDAIGADLREWLRRASEEDSGYEPWRFELSFGLGDGQKRRQADAHSSPKAVNLDCGIQLRGSIDLVERRPSGHLRITDHKTGKANGGEEQIIAGGTSLQPALYALVAEKLFRGELEVDRGRLYFCTSAVFGRRIRRSRCPTRSVHPKFRRAAGNDHWRSAGEAVFASSASRAAMHVVRL